MSNDEKNASAKITSEKGWNAADMNPKRRKTLRDYLGAMTSGNPAAYSNKAEIPEVSIDNTMENRFEINSEPDFKISNVTETGEPIKPIPVSFGQKHFVPNTVETQNLKTGTQFDVEDSDPNSKAAEIFNNISSNSFFDQSKIEKITEDVEFKNNQTFGHDIVKKTVPISEQVSSVLKNNRFFPNKKIFSEKMNKESFQEFTDSETNKASFGEEDYYKESNSDEFAKLGLKAMLNASGYVGKSPLDYKYSNSKMGPFNFDKTTGPDANIVGIWSEVIGQLGTGNLNSLGDNVEDSKVFTGAQKVRSSIVNPNKSWLGKNENINVTYIDSNGKSSTKEGTNRDNFEYHGALTNYIDKFTDSKIFGKHHIMSVSWMTAIFVQSLVTAAIIDALASTAYATLLLQPDLKVNYDNQLGPQNSSQPPRLRKGRSRGHIIESDLTDENSKEIMDLLGIPDLDELLSGPFLLDLLLAFMGINKPVDSKSIVISGFPIGIFLAYTAAHTIGALQTFILALKDPWSGGFFANLGRAIARNSREFDESLASQTANSIASGGEKNAFISFILELPQSSSFRWFKTMVDLGNNSIGQFMAKSRTEGELVVSRVKNSGVTHGFVHPQSVMQSPSQFLLPKSFINAKTLMGDSAVTSISGKNHFGAKDKSGKNVVPDKRLDQDDADKLEHVLDEEYMPFYIRDMRTSEVISFHAFLNSFSDGFAANYSEIKGVGRVEAAPIYDGATRSISFGFTMAAFSKEDMDYMYWKLNKLVTLMYPQWSKGTQLKAPVEAGGKKTFYMPFSQMPTASPMIRLRIGDVITNNYSDMSAMRMMGLGDEATATFEDNEPLVATPVNQITNPSPNQMAKIEKSALVPGVPSPIGAVLHTQVASDQPRTGDRVVIDASRAEMLIMKIANLSVPPTAISPAVISNDTSLGAFFPIGKMFDKHYESLRKEAGIILHSQWMIVGFSSKSEGIVYLENIVSQGSIKSGLQKKIENKYKMSNPALQRYSAIKNPVFGVRYNDLKNYWEPMVKNSRAAASEEEAKFLVGNPLIRSFENNRGSGIAGFLTSLDIDWGLNTVQWATDKGLRAPTLIKVSCNFKPIHDIAPGIDADGFNRAPVYKIGQTSRSVHELPTHINAILKSAKTKSETE